MPKRQVYRVNPPEIEEKRKVQKVTRPLRGVGSILRGVGSILTNQSPPLSRNKPPKHHQNVRDEILSGVLIPLYHNGLRIEKTPGGGIDNDENTWDHFGLLPAGKNEKSRVILDTKPFKPATTCWQGHTTWSREQIESVGKELINNFGGYHLLQNNCQNFAFTLSDMICDVRKPYDVVHPGYLSKKRT